MSTTLFEIQEIKGTTELILSSVTTKCTHRIGLGPQATLNSAGQLLSLFGSDFVTILKDIVLKDFGFLLPGLSRGTCFFVNGNRDVVFAKRIHALDLHSIWEVVSNESIEPDLAKVSAERKEGAFSFVMNPLNDVSGRLGNADMKFVWVPPKSMNLFFMMEVGAFFSEPHQDTMGGFDPKAFGEALSRNHAYPYLVAWHSNSKTLWHRLPLPNLFPTGVLCTGNLDAAVREIQLASTGNRHVVSVEELLDIVIQAWNLNKWTEHLMTGTRLKKLQRLIRFDTGGKQLNLVPLDASEKLDPSNSTEADWRLFTTEDSVENLPFAIHKTLLAMHERGFIPTVG